VHPSSVTSSISHRSTVTSTWREVRTRASRRPSSSSVSRPQATTYGRDSGFPILSMTAMTGESWHLEASYTVGPYGEPHRRRSTPQNPYRMRALAVGSPYGAGPCAFSWGATPSRPSDVRAYRRALEHPRPLPRDGESRRRREGRPTSTARSVRCSSQSIRSSANARATPSRSARAEPPLQRLTTGLAVEVHAHTSQAVGRDSGVESRRTRIDVG
jgi:hypothetical protein